MIHIQPEFINTILNMLDELCAQSFLSFKHINNINNIEDLSCFPFIQKVNKIHKIFFVCNYFSFAIHKTKIQLKMIYISIFRLYSTFGIKFFSRI